MALGLNSKSNSNKSYVTFGASVSLCEEWDQYDLSFQVIRELNEKIYVESLVCTRKLKNCFSLCHHLFESTSYSLR